MAIFLTGSTGYLGSYLAAGLFTGHSDSLNLLVRAKSEQEARDLLALGSGVPCEELPGEAAEIIAECGCLPLALALCGGLIRRRLA